MRAEKQIRATRFLSEAKYDNAFFYEVMSGSLQGHGDRSCHGGWLERVVIE